MRWAGLLLPREGMRVGRVDVWIAMILSGARVRTEDDCVSVHFPSGVRLYSPARGAHATWAVVREMLISHWRHVGVLDQYDATAVLKQGMVVLDVGANTGCFTVLASKLVGASGKVVALEPIGDNFRCLEKTIEANNLANATPLQFAVGDGDGELEIMLAEPSGQHSAVLERGRETVRVPVRTLDSLVAELGLERVDFIKVDVEGMEPEVLRGARETIRRFRPHLAVSAYHLPEHRELLPRIVSEIGADYRIEIKCMARGLEEEMFARPTARSRGDA